MKPSELTVNTHEGYFGYIESPVVTPHDKDRIRAELRGRAPLSVFSRWVLHRALRKMKW